MKVVLERGEGAWRRLRDPAFVRAWRDLESSTPWPSLFQGPDYCLAWYEAYSSRHEPLLVSAGGAELEGLLPLAVLDGRLCHPGDHQCEYQGWLARPAVAESFAAAAVSAALAEAGGGVWHWPALAPGAPTGWLASLGAGNATLDRRDCPLMDVTDVDFLAARAKGRLRSHRNHFERRGLRYERVGDPARARAVLDRLATWCDLRQGAAHDTMPFTSDPAKLDFHRRLLEAGERLWLSALWLEQELLAVHLGPFDGNELAMGVQAYDPREGRRSPGALLILEMAADVAAAGGTTLDLTPGGDPWKERWASHHRTVHRLDLHRSRLGATLAGTGRALEAGARRVLRTAGADPRALRAGLERRLARVTGSSPAPPPRPALAELDTIQLQALGSGPSAAFSHPYSRADEPDPGDFDRLLVRTAAECSGAGSAMLAAASRALAEDWTPWCVHDDHRLEALVWTPPIEGWVDLGDLDVVRCRRDTPDAGAVALPEDVLLLRSTSLGDQQVGPLRRLLGRVHEALAPTGPVWLLADSAVIDAIPELARPLAPAEEQRAG